MLFSNEINDVWKPHLFLRNKFCHIFFHKIGALDLSFWSHAWTTSPARWPSAGRMVQAAFISSTPWVRMAWSRGSAPLSVLGMIKHVDVPSLFVTSHLEVVVGTFYDLKYDCFTRLHYNIYYHILPTFVPHGLLWPVVQTYWHNITK